MNSLSFQKFKKELTERRYGGPVKGKAYNKQPVVMVFRTSNRSNAKTKMKVWRNENIDWIITQDKLAGVPSNAEIL